MGLEIHNKVPDTLQALARRLGNARPLFEEIDLGVVENTQGQLRRFENRTRWAALAPRYEVYKRKVVGDVPILIFTGALADLYATAGVIRDDSYEFGPNDEIAMRHHHGDPLRRLPARPLSYSFAAPLCRKAFSTFVHQAVKETV